MPATANAAIPNPLPPESIAEIATTAGFSTLVSAVTAAGLAPTLADCSAGPFTVFAPTNAAFAAGAAEVTAATSLATLQGESIAVNGTVLNGSVDITATNNWACNGVVHVVDGVLSPPSLTAPAPTTTVPTTTAAPTTTVAPVTELPATGNDATLALLAGLLVLAGAGLLIARRRPTV